MPYSSLQFLPHVSMACFLFVGLVFFGGGWGKPVSMELIIGAQAALRLAMSILPIAGIPSMNYITLNLFFSFPFLPFPLLFCPFPFLFPLLLFPDPSLPFLPLPSPLPFLLSFLFS